MKTLELLAPAKNCEYAKIAIDHGADAVYMGASRFGARARAGNSIREIAQVVNYAHQYGAKVYITVNTLLFDQELEDALQEIRAIYNAGADAIIIQDMGLLAMDLPPIEIHASTQCHNNSLEKIQFLKNVGIKRVVLPREFSLGEMKEISSQCDVELEAFVHGALCVSYSGQCYMSHALNGRSGNRGNCAQLCRTSFDLINEQQDILKKDSYLLSLKDFNAAEFLPDLIAAGISSFKIEGRLKDEFYLKNTTAFYRRQIDKILEENTGTRASSSGKTTFFFEPNPLRTFQRPFTSYNLGGEKSSFASLNTQKSLGMEVAVVRQSYPSYLVVLPQETIIAGDGLCFFDEDGDLQGFGVNQVIGSKIYTQKEVKAKAGTVLYRNQDLAFERILKGNTAQRKIGLQLFFKENSQGFELKGKDEDGVEAKVTLEIEKQLAKNEGQIPKQLLKLGNTIFIAETVNIEMGKDYFIPSSVLNELRRELIDKLCQLRVQFFKAKEVERKDIFPNYMEKEIDYRSNVLNHKAVEFYKNHGVVKVEQGFELLSGSHDYKGKNLMISKYCIKFELNQCPKAHVVEEKYKLPLFLRNQKKIFALDFDCNTCIMSVKSI